jgi:hypothetical protein
MCVPDRNTGRTVPFAVALCCDFRDNRLPGDGTVDFEASLARKLKAYVTYTFCY